VDGHLGPADLLLAGQNQGRYRQGHCKHDLRGEANGSLGLGLRLPLGPWNWELETVRWIVIGKTDATRERRWLTVQRPPTVRWFYTAFRWGLSNGSGSYLCLLPSLFFWQKPQISWPKSAAENSGKGFRSGTLNIHFTLKK